MIPRLTVVAGCVALSACVVAPEEETVALSPEVLAIVAPGQAIGSARIEADGCYWYRHRGPVETTYIPILTDEGRMICIRPQS